RKLEADVLIIAVNAGTTTAQVQVEVSPELSPRHQIVYGDASFTWNQNNLAIDLPPRTGCILG
ncbi:MAG: alpha-amylase, partial [Coleofasciculus sp. C2-GNP5-27]